MVRPCHSAGRTAIYLGDGCGRSPTSVAPADTGSSSAGGHEGELEDTGFLTLQSAPPRRRPPIVCRPGLDQHAHRSTGSPGTSLTLSPPRRPNAALRHGGYRSRCTAPSCDVSAAPSTTSTISSRRLHRGASGTSQAGRPLRRTRVRSRRRDPARRHSRRRCAAAVSRMPARRVQLTQPITS